MNWVINQVGSILEASCVLPAHPSNLQDARAHVLVRRRHAPHVYDPVTYYTYRYVSPYKLQLKSSQHPVEH